MIKKILIQNFKGITNLSIKPKKITLITGRNNTGKTTILEAIHAADNPSKIAGTYRNSLPYLITSGEQSASVELHRREKTKLELAKLNPAKSSLVLRDYFVSKAIEAAKLTRQKKLTEAQIKKIKDTVDKNVNRETIQNFVTNALTIKGSGKFSKTRVSKTFSRARSTQTIISEVSKILKVPNPLLRFTIEETDFVGVRNTLAHESTTLIRTQSTSRRPPLTETTLNFIEDAIKEYDLLENLERLGSKMVVIKSESHKYEVPFEFLGDGFKEMINVLRQLVPAESRKNIHEKTLLLDEPASHMHPGYIQQFVRMFARFSKESNVQTFACTHNSDLIYEMLSENLPKDVKSYFQKNLGILRMQRINEILIGDYIDYNSSLEMQHDLLTDMRGL